MVRTFNRATFIAFAFATLVACSRSEAFHNSDFFDFEPGGLPLLNCTKTGGVCLASSPGQTLTHGIGHILPAHNSVTGEIDGSSRIVLLSFDIVNPFPSIVAGNFQVTAKSYYNYQFPHDPQEVISNFTVFNDSVQLFSERQSRSTSFVFNSVNDGFFVWQSLELQFSFASFTTQGAWGLDNVRIDWGQPVPEPAAFGLMLTVALICLSGIRLRKGFLTRRITA